VNQIRFWLEGVCTYASADKDGGAGNAGAGESGSGNNCEFKVLVTAIPYGSVSNSSTTVRSAAVPAQA